MQPVKKQLKRFTALCGTNEEYQRKLDMLARASTSEEWKVVIEILWAIKNEMAIELLQSSKFTKESLETKDITQKVYHNISEWIDFLTRPKRWIAKKGRLQLINLKGGKPERREKSNG